jgi:hypothetical protein
MDTAIPSPPTPHPSPADTLRQAAEYLRRYGWIQHRYFANLTSPTPSACTLGALYIVTHGRVHTQPYEDVFDGADQSQEFVRFLNAQYALILYLGLHTPNAAITSLHDWNDHQDRHQSGVILALHQAAEDFDHPGGAR